MNGFMQDGEGNKSSSRLLMVVGVVAILGVWGMVSVQAGVMQDIPLGVLGVLVALITGKQVNSYFTEKPEPQQAAK